MNTFDVKMFYIAEESCCNNYCYSSVGRNGSSARDNSGLHSAI